MSPADIVRVLSELRGPFSEEEKLRDAIAIALGPHALREAKVGEHERIDFLVGRIGIEAKIRGTRSDVTRQLFRYAESPDIDEIILVTTRYQHTVRAPTALLGKPLTIVVCWGAML